MLVDVPGWRQSRQKGKDKGVVGICTTFDLSSCCAADLSIDGVTGCITESKKPLEKGWYVQPGTNT